MWKVWKIISALYQQENSRAGEIEIILDGGIDFTSYSANVN